MFVGACSTHGRDEKCVKYLVGKLENKRPFGRQALMEG
jgi:hypothetical protein